MVSYHDDNGILEVQPLHGDREPWVPAGHVMTGRLGLFAAPVLEADAAARHICLPAGCRWILAATADRHGGGETIQVTVSPERMPVFAREGAEVLDAVR